MNTDLVTLAGVSKHYGAQRAIDGLDLQLRQGECVALAGHNGAGKSTLIKLVLGLIRPTHGRVTLFGEDAHSRAAARLRDRIGYLPETVALHPSLTGVETLAFYARLKRRPLSGNPALLEKVGIAGAAHRRVGGYSKGMRQRLALAQALLGEPRVLLFDEPTTGLDPASRLMFYDIVHELRAAGATVLLSTHALSELAGHADRIIVMKAGRKIADGAMSALRQSTGLPIRIRLTLASPQTGTVLARPWRRLDACRYELACLERDKVDAIRGIGAIAAPIADLDIQAPSLDDIYAHLLEREDI
ncbi:MAG: ABC transporter ATP-binding protein [Achromobacter sp.]|jgi:Cu-processing system ATP-binding protein|uniref:Putative ABC transporter ATP-binding protein NosF n=1 Tax=Achromobacter insuavis TaxID=1287735 RepID=A0A6J5BCS0_9BURK|nr:MULTISPECIES: ABC transporter ATP-binding protein [Achromobacter]MBN9637184.1 ABC transporter ATP-binding protein [Achromobacter sp.]MCG2598170.1 ABC transporter ATP-binding protein [Achromobacter sp.]MCG2604698.1 ABC transporter ATP-binding protein [Achromobacter sp.]CAB3698921.1 putative ABC transporter ATP-binding protein NosF [Achromobacter insuavis]CUI83433.1 Daunorubicin/doxorubicin resistance ATP-binding protein DrrA [Achromobacter sp. 2789STDY5608628]